MKGNNCQIGDKLLLGKRVLVTRAKNQASALSEALRKEGALPIEFPLIKTVPPKSYRALDDAIGRLPEGYDWLIFTSANAVRCFMERLHKVGKDALSLAGVSAAAIGPATATALENLDIDVDYLPKDAVAESVVEGFAEMGVEGKRFLIPRAEVAREIIPEKLAEMGALVEVVDAYRTVLDDSAGGKLRELFEEGKIDIITFTSSSTVKSFVALLDGDIKALLNGVAVAAIGPVTAETARGLGLEVSVVAGEHTINGLIRALIKS
ncbi:MAG: uroporphyrinogen-III synthase [Actinobacteria bacterium]|nr:uroporphyrinogen-III synthase [Actinomycetota bacterium]